MSGVPLPKPVDYKPKIEVDKNHGLWGFFAKPGVLMETPEEMVKHGRAWTVEELRRKSWEDLHGLWWVCCRELNMLSTAREELKRSEMGFGDQELIIREKTVRHLLGMCVRDANIGDCRSARRRDRSSMLLRNDSTLGRMQQMSPAPTLRLTWTPPTVTLTYLDRTRRRLWRRAWRRRRRRTSRGT
jgi:hypothetical protein